MGVRFSEEERGPSTMWRLEDDLKMNLDKIKLMV